jgi:predicted nuclease of predicted toxin-antitoxin system
MILWIDAQLSPALARWLSNTFAVTAHAVRDLRLRDAKDLPIFSRRTGGWGSDHE